MVSNSKIRLILWGMGKNYNSHLNLLKYEEAAEEIEIVAVTANELPHISWLDGWRVVEKKVIQALKYDYILVMNEKYHKDIVKDIVALGIDRRKIIPCRVLNIPYFNWWRYIDIRESEVSIVCNNCFGGILYHTLGMECRSPFKNLSLGAGELLRMLPNLKHYLSFKPEFVRWKTDPHSKERYPVMRINDIEIHFNHDFTVEAATENWLRRSRKFNYDNVFVSIYTEDEAVIENFLRMDSFEAKVCFVPNTDRYNKWKNEPGVWALDYMPGQTEFWEPVNSNVTVSNNALTYQIIELLHMEKIYRIKY